MKKAHSRRTFLNKSIGATLALPFLGSSLLSCESGTENQATETAESGKKLSILILGGTSFLGPHQIAYALGRGHSVSTFTRGKTKPTVYQDLFEQVEQLVGDREDDLTALEGRQWDVVIDNSGRNAEWTKRSAALLKGNADFYLYTSSTGVYYPYLGDDIGEDTELVLAVPEDLEDEEQQMEYGYGVMKSQSEREAIAAFGKDNTIIVRPTYMAGPADKTNRFIYWPLRLSKGGETLVPGKADDLVQYVDVRDVAEWMIRLLEEKKAGIYNAVGPAADQTIHAFVEEAQDAFQVESTFVMVDDYDFLKEHKIFYIVPWIMIEGNNFGSARINNQKALSNGLSLRPITETVKDTYDWWHSDSLTQEKRDEYEQDPESLLAREATILEAWKVAAK